MLLANHVKSYLIPSSQPFSGTLDVESCFLVSEILFGWHVGFTGARKAA
jgi:hypothetical protein